MLKRLIAEFLGTFTLSLAVLLSVSLPSPLPTPFLASLVLLLFVYTIGGISGCYINPAVTLGLLSIKKVEFTTAMWYIASQVLGAVAALLLISTLGITHNPVVPVPLQVYAFELLGTTLFTFGIASVVFDHQKSHIGGVIIGGSLLLGILLSLLGGAAGVLNPAVAVSLGTTAIGYYVAEIVGGILGFQLYAFLAGHTNHNKK